MSDFPHYGRGVGACSACDVRLIAVAGTRALVSIPQDVARRLAWPDHAPIVLRVTCLEGPIEAHRLVLELAPVAGELRLPDNAASGNGRPRETR